MGWKEGADSRIASFLESEFDEPGVAAHFIIVIDLIRGDGEADLAFNVAPGQRSAMTVGLLRTALVLEEEGLKREWFNDPDG